MAVIEKVASEAAGQADGFKDEAAADIGLTPDEDKLLLHKIDRSLLVVMAFSYFFQFLDKTSLSATAILGLPQDLHLKGQEYSWSSGIYYVGYLAASFPAGLLMVRWRVGKTIAFSVLIWGAILMLTALSFNASGLLAVRFFLGVSEAAIAPGLTVVISMWYKRSEQPLRHAAWFLGNICAGLFGGLIGFGIGHIQSIEPWKAVFLILGAVTVSWALCLFILLPDTPGNAWFLNSEEKNAAIVRVKENLTGIKNSTFKWDQCKEALTDVKTWFIFFIQIASNIPNGGVTTFGTIVIAGFGFSTFNTLLLSSAPYLVQLIFILVSTISSSRYQNTRTYWMMFHLAIAIVGAAMVRQLPSHDKAGRLAGLCLLSAFSANFPLTMSLLSGNFGGFTKKATVNAVSFIAYCAGNIIGPQLFFDRQAPSYNSGFLAMIVCLAASFILALCFRLYLTWENRNRDRRASALDGGYVNSLPIIDISLVDETDKKISQFRYVY